LNCCTGGFVVRLGHAQVIGAIAHRLYRLEWKILHDGVTYEERGPAVSKERVQSSRQDDSRTAQPWRPRRSRPGAVREPTPIAGNFDPV
jgi:hypothetical protein